MHSRTTKRFRDAFDRLPKDVQEKARRAFELWKSDSNHPSLKFKQVHSTEPIYSVRIGLGWRALGIREDDTMIWFWIGSHADYDEMISKL